MLPIHFNYNFMERDKIPLHNEKFSRAVADQQRQTDVITKGFFDNSLPVPSHVVLNHINSWETMASVDVANRSPEEMSNASQRMNQESDAGITEGPTAASMGAAGEHQKSAAPPLTCMTMAQRLNRSKFLTIVYYKPGGKQY